MSKISDFEEVAEFHDTHVYELELMNRIKIGNVDSLINFYHTVSYVYQVFKVKLLRDDFGMTYVKRSLRTGIMPLGSIRHQ